MYVHAQVLACNEIQCTICIKNPNQAIISVIGASLISTHHHYQFIKTKINIDIGGTEIRKYM